MQSFLTSITVLGISPTEMGPLREKEGLIMQQYAEAGFLKAAYVRKDLTGAFLIFDAHSDEHVHELVAGLPMFPYMTVTYTALINE